MLKNVAFRYRVIWIGLVFAVGAWGSFALYQQFHGFFGPLVGVLSLPVSGMVFASRGSPHWAPWALLPVALIVANFGLRAWAAAYLSSRVVHDADMHSSTLVVSGPYSYVRNPLYVANLLLAFGFGVLFPPPGVFLVVGMLWGFLALIASQEGRRLAEEIPGYAEYASHVRAFVPRLTPWRPPVQAARSRPDWADGLVGEAWNLGFALWVVLLGSPMHHVATPIFFLAMLLWWIGLQAWRRRTASGHLRRSR